MIQVPENVIKTKDITEKDNYLFFLIRNLNVTFRIKEIKTSK